MTVSDAKPQQQIQQEIPALLDKGITVETGKHGARTFQRQGPDCGQPRRAPELPQLAAARRAGIAVIGEIELAARFLEGEIIAITGSNGKTTTTTLTGEVIAAGGCKTLVGGNIGTPAISFVEQLFARHLDGAGDFQLSTGDDRAFPPAHRRGSEPYARPPRPSRQHGAISRGQGAHL